MTREIELIELARDLGPKLASVNVDSEKTCKPEKRAIEQLRTNGLLAMTIPSAYGGIEADALTCLKVIEELSYWDSGIGWSTMIYSKTALLGACVPEEHASQMFGVRDSNGVLECPIAAGAAAPTGQAQVVDGGIVVSGRWSWGSGAAHADWIAGGTIVEKEGETVSRNGQPALHLVFFEKEDVRLLDNWDPSGLRGTGSGDFEVVDVFVPDGRWMIIGDVAPFDSPLFKFPAFSYFALSVAAVPLGIARRAVDDFDSLMSGRIPSSTSKTIATAPITQREFGEAESLVLGAHHYVWGQVECAWEKVTAGIELTAEDRRELRMAAVQATLMCTQAVDLLYHAAGGGAVQGDSPMQRHFRDIHVATQHRQVSREFLRVSGGMRLDNEVAPTI